MCVRVTHSCNTHTPALKSCCVQVSLLSCFETADTWRDWTVGVHGIIIECVVCLGRVACTRHSPYLFRMLEQVLAISAPHQGSHVTWVACLACLFCPAPCCPARSLPHTAPGRCLVGSKTPSWARAAQPHKQCWCRQFKQGSESDCGLPVRVSHAPFIGPW